MNISEFAESRHVGTQTVSKYISRHPELFDGLVTREGKSVVLSDAALEKLDAVYPLPKPVEVIVDHASRDKLILAQERIIQLQEQLTAQAQLVADARYYKLMIEQKDSAIESRDQELAEQSAALKEKDAALQESEKNLQDKDSEIEQLREQLDKMSADLQAEREQRETMENAGLFKRIFRKWG